MWHDPPWVREGRAPSLNELIPHTDREVDRHVDDVRRAMAAHLDGRTFAGLSVRLDLTDPHSVSVYRDSLVVRLDILDRDAGVVVGSTVRSFSRDHDGSLYVEHVSLRLTDQAQGGGFARDWNRYLEGWYRESGVSHIEVHASSTIGGYAWARAGYDWAPNTEHRANSVLQRLALQMRQIDDHIADVGRWAAGDGGVDIAALQRRYGAEHPDDLVTRMRQEYAAGQDILDRARRYPFGSAGYPTPSDISHAGWDGRTGRDATWIGKEALLGSDWKGVKPISETGPLHPRPRGPEITAAAVPESAFHGLGRDAPAPDAVAALGRAALADRIAALPPDSPLRGVHIGFSAVDARALPDGAVARSVPFEGGFRIELSDRAAEATVSRAVAHEVAELSAIRAREASGLDVSVADALRPGPLAEGATLSPHDMGRLAEVDVLAHMLADPARAPNARAELTALRDHLGLRPDDPGATARRELVDPYLRRLGHDPALIWADGGGPWSAVRASGLPDVSPSDLRAAMAELRAHFPKEWVRIDGDTVRIVHDATTVTVQVRVGTGEGPATAGHVVEIPPRTPPENVVRTLVDRVATIVAAETGGRPDAGQLRQIDVLSTEHARIRFQAARHPDASEEQTAVWVAEEARVTREFRALAERMGILRPEGSPDTDPEVRARRDDVWAEVSDGSRAMLFSMADPSADVGASSKARSFLPMTDDFRWPYNAIDNFTYFVEEHAPPAVRERFQAEVLRRVREFQTEALARFKAAYRGFFPSTSTERPLPPEAADAARERVAPLVDDVRAMVEDLRRWADSTGVEELRRDRFDDAVDRGEQAWQARYERFKQIVDEVVGRFTYCGEPLGYIGSMQDGMRGPHKAMAHADLRSFDVDLYVVHPDEYDRLYDIVRENAPNAVSRGKIFPTDKSVTPELSQLSKQIADALSEAFPDNSDIEDSMVVLRREPPY